jgi:hypothetical protein
VLELLSENVIDSGLQVFEINSLVSHLLAPVKEEETTSGVRLGDRRIEDFDRNRDKQKGLPDELIRAGLVALPRSAVLATEELKLLKDYVRLSFLSTHRNRFFLLRSIAVAKMTLSTRQTFTRPI